MKKNWIFLTFGLAVAGNAAEFEVQCENSEMHASITVNENGTLRNVIPWFQENGQWIKSADVGCMDAKISGVPVKNLPAYSGYLRYTFSDSWQKNGSDGIGWLVLPQDLEYTSEGFNAEIRLNSSDASDERNNNTYALQCHVVDIDAMVREYFKTRKSG